MFEHVKLRKGIGWALWYFGSAGVLSYASAHTVKIHAATNVHVSWYSVPWASFVFSNFHTIVINIYLQLQFWDALTILLSSQPMTLAITDVDVHPVSFVFFLDHGCQIKHSESDKSLCRRWFTEKLITGVFYLVKCHSCSDINLTDKV